MIARPSLLWFTMGMLLIVIRTLLWVRYRPFAAVSVKQAPRLTIVIPAYIEGAMVRKVVDACARAEYPRDRLEIIVVNDGSTDDTQVHVDQAHRDRPGLVQAVHFYTLYFLHSERSREFLFGVLCAYSYSLTLLWIFPYALVTVRNRAWLTR